MSEGPVLRPEEIAGVLSGVDAAAGAPVGAPPAGPMPYSFREPLAIPKEAEAPARKRLEDAAAAIGESLRTELGTEIAIELDAFQQQRSQAAVSAIPPPAWLLSFGLRGGGGVALALAPATALSLFERALGGAGSAADASRGPTALESRVMAKILPRMAAGLSRSMGVELTPVGLASAELPAQVASPGEVLGVGLLRIKSSQGERAALVLATCGLLVPAQKRASAGARKVGPLAAPLERVRLEIRPALDAGFVMVSELAELVPGAVLRFDVAADAALELRVRERPLFSGRIVRDGKGSAFAVSRRFRRARVQKEQR
jgi:flagellar motor switch protein FliM